MRVCVAVKQVPRAARGFDRRTGALERTGERLLNPPDARALEVALRLREREPDVEVVAVTMGPAQAVDALLHAAALGADRAVHLTDAALAGSDLLGTSLALAAVLARETPDLVLFGERSDDAACGALAGAVAERLEMPSVVHALRVELAGDAVRCERIVPGGTDAVALELPAVVGVSEGAAPVRWPTVRAVMAARAVPTATLGLAELGLPAEAVGRAGARVRCGSFAPASRRPAGPLLPGKEVEATVGKVVAWLEQRGYA